MDKREPESLRPQQAAKLGERYIHLEGFGMLRRLTDRVAYANNTTSNQTTEGTAAGSASWRP